MKKDNILWFTLIELLFVISIISTLTIVWFSSFWKTFENSNFKNKSDLLFNEIKSLDSNIWNKISDYDLFLFWWKNYYYYYENSLYKNKLQSLEINWNKWILSTNDYLKNEMILKVYENNKLITNKFLSSTWSYEFFIDNSKNKKILWLINDEVLNSVNIIFFDYIYDQGLDYKIDKIYTDNQTLTWIIISNYIWWKKVYKDLNWIIIDKKIKIDFSDTRNFTTLNLN